FLLAAQRRFRLGSRRDRDNLRSARTLRVAFRHRIVHPGEPARLGSRKERGEGNIGFVCPHVGLSGRLNESRLPESAEVLLPGRPTPEVVQGDHEGDRRQRRGGRLPQGREAKRDGPVQRGPAEKRDDGGPVPSAAVPVVPPLARKEVIRVAPRLHDEVIDEGEGPQRDRKSTRLNSSHVSISYAVFCL